MKEVRDVADRRPDGTARSAVRGSSVTLLGQLITFVIQTSSLVILARLLSPTDYGVFAMAFVLVGIASVFSDMGLSLASVRDMNISQGAKSNLFWINVAVGSTLAASLYLLAPIAGSFYGKPDVVEVIQVLSCILLLGAISSQSRAEMSRSLRFKSQALVDVSAQFIGLGVALGAAYGGAGYWALAWQQVAIFGVTTAGLTATAKWFPGLPDKRSSVRSHIRFGINTSGLQIINYVSNNIDSVLIGKLLGAQPLGFYNRATQIFRLPIQQVASPLSRVAIPVLSRVYGTPDFTRYALRSQLILGYSLVLMYGLLAGIARPLVELVLGNSWAQAVPVLQILCVGGAFQAFGYVYYWMFVAADKTGLQFRWGLVGRGGMIGLIGLGSYHGIFFVASAVSIGLLLVWLLLTIFVVPTTGIRRSTMLSGVLRPAMLSMLMFGGTYYISHITISLSAIASLGLCAVWVIVVIILSLSNGAFRRDYKDILSTASMMR